MSAVKRTISSDTMSFQLEDSPVPSTGSRPSSIEESSAAASDIDQMQTVFKPSHLDAGKLEIVMLQPEPSHRVKSKESNSFEKSKWLLSEVAVMTPGWHVVQLTFSFARRLASACVKRMLAVFDWP